MNTEVNKKSIAKIIILLCCVSLVACSSPWVLVTRNNQTLKLGQLSLQAPSGWVISNEHANQYAAIVEGEQVNYKVDRIMVTKNGIQLDLIDILRFELSEAFPNIGETADNTMLPSELAEKYLAEKQTESGHDDFTIVKNEPVSIALNRGFRIHYQFKSNEGLQYDKLVYGFVTTKGFYTISFRAPALHYFKFNLVDFNTMLNSIVINS